MDFLISAIIYSVIVQVHLSPTLTVQAQLDKIAKCLQTVIKAGFEAKCRVAIALAILSEQAMPGKTVQWLSVYTHKDSRNLDYFSFEVVISRSPVWNYGPASSSCSEHVKEVYHGDYDKFQTHQYDVDLSSVQIALANVLPNSEAKYIDPSTSSESILSHESKSSGRIHDDIKVTIIASFILCFFNNFFVQQSIGKLPDATDIIILCDGVSWPFMPRQQHKSTDTSSLLLPEDSTNSNPGIKGRSVSPTSSTFTPDWISFRQKHQNKMFHFVAVGSKSKKK